MHIWLTRTHKGGGGERKGKGRGGEGEEGKGEGGERRRNLINILVNKKNLKKGS